MTETPKDRLERITRILESLKFELADNIAAGGFVGPGYIFYGLVPDDLRILNEERIALSEAEKERERQCTRETRQRRNQEKFLAEALAIEAEEAKSAGTLAFMARVLVQATMPHSAQEANVFKRSNGALTVEIVASSRGLPYGSYPRLLLTWLTTEAVRTRSPQLYLGDSLSDFMSKLDLLPTGGRWGTIPRLTDQAMRLFRSFVTAYDTHVDTREHRIGGERGKNIMVAEDWDVWWDPRESAQGALFQSWVKLTDTFYQQVTERPVPIDLRAIRALKKSPLALDLYTWSTYRMSYLNHRTEIPWEVLQLQFGADYASTPQGRRDFKKKLIGALKKVATVYPKLRADEGERGLVLLPSPTHVRMSK